MNTVILSVVREGSEAGLESVARVPVDGEVDTGRVDEVLVRADGSGTVGNHVLRQAGLLVSADSITLGTIRRLSIHVLGIDTTGDIEAVAVIGGDDDEGIFEFTDFLEVLQCGLDGIVELEKFAESTRVRIQLAKILFLILEFTDRS